MATWRSAEPSSAGCLDLAECVRTNRKTLAPNQKQLSAEVRRRAVVSEVGATGFEPAASRSRTVRSSQTVLRPVSSPDVVFSHQATLFLTVNRRSQSQL